MFQLLVTGRRMCSPSGSAPCSRPRSRPSTASPTRQKGFYRSNLELPRSPNSRTVSPHKSGTEIPEKVCQVAEHAAVSPAGRQKSEQLKQGKQQQQNQTHGQVKVDSARNENTSSDSDILSRATGTRREGQGLTGALHSRLVSAIPVLCKEGTSQKQKTAAAEAHQQLIGPLQSGRAAGPFTADVAAAAATTELTRSCYPQSQGPLRGDLSSPAVHRPPSGLIRSGSSKVVDHSSLTPSLLGGPQLSAGGASTPRRHSNHQQQPQQQQPVFMGMVAPEGATHLSGPLSQPLHAQIVDVANRVKHLESLVRREVSPGECRRIIMERQADPLSWWCLLTSDMQPGKGGHAV
jgi:hypothetical protein